MPGQSKGTADSSTTTPSRAGCSHQRRGGGSLKASAGAVIIVAVVRGSPAALRPPDWGNFQLESSPRPAPGRRGGSRASGGHSFTLRLPSPVTAGEPTAGGGAMRENWKIGPDAAPLEPGAAAGIATELAERIARRPAPGHPPLLLYGALAFTLGIAGYLAGVLMVFPRYLGLEPWLGPVSHAIVWYSGVPIVGGISLALVDLLLFLDRKRPDLPVRYRPLVDRRVTVALTAYN